MSKEKKISLAIVLGVLLLTAFFLFEALNLKINGDFTRFFPWDEIDDVYYVEPKEDDYVEVLSYNGFEFEWHNDMWIQR